MSEPIITIEDDPPDEDIDLLWNELDRYNFSQTDLEGKLISVFLRNEQNKAIGGAHATRKIVR